MAPNHRHSNNTVELYSIRGELRINKYTPAVTIVAACISAETGVGPSQSSQCKIKINTIYIRITLLIPITPVK